MMRLFGDLVKFVCENAEKLVGGVDVLRFRLRPFELVVELSKISSVLSYEESGGLRMLDPAPFLGLEATRSGHVGLVEGYGGPPLGVCFGEVWGTEKWGVQSLLEIPGWLHAGIPGILRKGCGYDNLRRVVWLLDLDELVRSGS